MLLLLLLLLLLPQLLLLLLLLVLLLEALHLRGWLMQPTDIQHTFERVGSASTPALLEHLAYDAAHCRPIIHIVHSQVRELAVGV